VSVKNPKRIVVDTSIVVAASQTEHPVSTRCREFLLCILNVCHRVVMTQDLNRERKKHQSKFSVNWYAAMVRRGKVKKVSDVRNSELRSLIYQFASSAKKLEAMEKDVLLLEASLATDNIIAALDEKIRTLFHELAKEYEFLKAIIWVNPVNEDEIPLEWLKTSAKPEKERQLGYDKNK